MSNAKKAVYAAVGAGEAALERAKSLPADTKSRIETTVKRVREFAMERAKKASKLIDGYARRGEKFIANAKPKKPPARKPRAKTESTEPVVTAAPDPVITEPVQIVEIVG